MKKSFKIMTFLLVAFVMFSFTVVYAQDLPDDNTSLVAEAPTIKVSKANNNSLLISWNEVDNATKYEIYRSTYSNKSFKKIKTLTTNNFTDEGLAYGTTYYYKVKAIGEENTKTSSVASRKVVPNKVVVEITSAGSYNIKLKWGKVSASGYKIAISTDNENFSTLKTITSGKTVEYNSKDLKANKVYYYKIKSYKTVNGTKVYSSWSDVVSYKTAPKEPTIELKASAYNKIDVTVNSVKGATSYKIYRSEDGKNFNKVATLTDSLVYKDEVTPTVKYYYKVKACNADLTCGSYSKVLNTKTKIKIPTLSGKSLLTSVSLNWNKIDYADGYKVYYSKSKTGSYTKIDTVSNTELIKDELIPDTTYYFKIRSYVKVDDTKYYSDYSSPIAVKPSIKKPTLLSLGVSGVKVTPEIQYSINDERVVFQILRSTDKSFNNTTKITVNLKDLNGENNIYTYDDKDLRTNTNYYYKVRAYVKFDGKKYYSSYSDALKIKTESYAYDYDGALTRANELKNTIKTRLELKQLLLENYILEEVNYALQNVEIDWNQLALSYVDEILDNLYSKEEMERDLIQQLFNSDEIEYALNNKDLDFNEIAYNRAYREHENYTESELNVYLTNALFTKEQVSYAMRKIALVYNPIKYVERQDEDNITIGDEVKIDDEHFYVIGVNNNKTTLISKYNLKVGRYGINNVSNGTSYYSYDSNEEGYGLQSPDMIGYKYGIEPKGVLSFSTTKYWANKVALLSGYEYYGAYGEEPYPYVYDSNSALYEHVENYVNVLKEKTGFTNINGRLLNYSEATRLGCVSSIDDNKNDCKNAPEWLHNTSFWLGNVGDNHTLLWTIGADNSFFNVSHPLDVTDNQVKYGVRPVIEIYTHEMPDGLYFKRDSEVKTFETLAKNVYEIAKTRFNEDKENVESYISYGNGGCYDFLIELEDSNVKFNIKFHKSGVATEYRITDGTHYYEYYGKDKIYNKDDIKYDYDSKPFELSACHNGIEFVTRKEENAISLGDMIKMADEFFYVVSSNESETVLLTKYNLSLGTDYQMPNSGGTNLNPYWGENGNPKPEYGDEYPIYYYDNHATMYLHVEAYVNILKERGLTDSITGRLMTKEEAELLPKSIRRANGGSTKYFLGTAYDDNRTYYVNSSGEIVVDNVTAALRPIIVIPTSEITGN